MDTVILNLLRKRRSIRKFQPVPVEREKIDALIEALVRTPTSRGRNPWEFIVVTDTTLLSQLGDAKESGSSLLSQAPLAVVFAADPTKSDVWTEDCSIAAFTLQLAAEEMGLGSCWVQIRLRHHDRDSSAEDFVKNLLGVPADLVVECVVGLGYPAEQKDGHTMESLPFESVHHNTFDS